MSTSKIYLCAVPQDVWTEPATAHGKQADIARFVSDALGCEQRIAKEVNLDNEYSRYTLCCQRIEQEIAASRRLATFQTADDFLKLVQSGRFPLFRVPDDYLVALAEATEHIGQERIGASFFPPDSLASHRAAFVQWSTAHKLADIPGVRHRTAFLRLAESAGCGVVEILSAYHPGSAAVAPERAMMGAEEEPGAEVYITLPEFSQQIDSTETFGRKKRELAATLRRHIREAITTGEPVAFGNEAQHDVIAEVLNEVTFVPAGEQPRPFALRVIYADGSEAAPFPVFSLSRSPQAELNVAATPLRVALMSMRHLELDPEIDFCWFRNRDVSRTRTLAETDRFCLDTTLSQLRDSLALGDLVIHMYHTGFEPAVIGFYRGVAQVLKELRVQRSSRRLIVVPFYYRGGTNYQAGTIWQ